MREGEGYVQRWTGRIGRIDVSAESLRGDQPEDLTELAESAIALVDSWLNAAARGAIRSEERMTRRLAGVVADPIGVQFAMRFVDRVVRPEDNRVAAQQLSKLVNTQRLPDFLSAMDKLLLRAGARVGGFAPSIVMPLARRRMRSLVGHLIVDAADEAITAHLGERRGQGYRLNVNLLGEAVLGEQEAGRRRTEVERFLRQPDVDYVSVKVSSVVSQLNYWDFERCVERVVKALRPLVASAQASSPPTFINLDMEEYHDLELTVRAFMALLDEPQFHSVDAGIVLQAYLPDSFDALRELSTWAAERGRRQVRGVRGGSVKVRLVKGANLAMERVDAEIHGWDQAPYATKAETDANYKRCLDWLFSDERLASMKVGIASHNLFDLAFAKLLADERGVADRVEFEMLEGMAPAHARTLSAEPSGLLLYTPIVAPDDFDVAISYLFRRLEENAADENFIHHLFTLRPGEPATLREASRFRQAVRERWTVGLAPRRRQDRSTKLDARHVPFTNSPDTDPALPANRRWVRESLAHRDTTARASQVDDVSRVDEIVTSARSGQLAWSERSVEERRATLQAVAHELERRRGELISCMVHEGRKTVAQADPEISEAIDFARYYADRALDLEASESAIFEPFGVITVAPPWNFPVAIAAGGVTAALAAGNSV
ncbi:MAG: bifunctional proline dehydrogenase/L-glutamate gamma-semialdehyde dehydrogenase, partial [Actinobacteria bacterium]|nr:bifunctional proline dehydrogenase/L-glutamate gamma-semialdehyde dehydrogenase [Actinomycetota bacterium]